MALTAILHGRLTRTICMPLATIEQDKLNCGRAVTTEQCNTSIRHFDTSRQVIGISRFRHCCWLCNVPNQPAPTDKSRNLLKRCGDCRLTLLLDSTSGGGPEPPFANSARGVRNLWPGSAGHYPEFFGNPFRILAMSSREGDQFASHVLQWNTSAPDFSLASNSL